MGLRDRVKKNVVSDKLTDIKLTIAGRPKVGKALDVNTKLPTPNGWVLAKDVKVGDNLFDRFGHPTQVTGVFPQGELQAYKVFLSDGTSFVVNDEHIIPLLNDDNSLYNLTLKEIIDAQDINTKEYRIPKSFSINYPEKEHKLRPSEIGWLIGSKNPMNANFLFGRSEEELSYYKEEVQRLKLDAPYEDRVIPDEYLFDSTVNRTMLWSSLLTEHGHISMENYIFKTTSETLAKSVRELALSLGVGATLTRDNDEYVVKSFVSEHSLIVDIQEVEPREMVCFKVDNLEELFLINDYIVTHNTSLFYEILKREGGIDKGLLLAFEKGYNFLPDINVIDIDSWETFVEVVDDLVEDNDGFDYLAFDTVDIASKLCEKYVLQKASRKDGKRYEALPDIPFGKAYDLLQAEFSEQMSRLEQAGFGLFFITHDKDRVVKEKSGTEYEKTSMSVSGRAGDYIKNSSDFIVFIDIENKKEKVNGKRVVAENRIMRFRGDGTTEAGGRIADVVETIEYDVDKFLEAIKESIHKQAERLKGDSKPQKKDKPKAEKKVEPVEDSTEDVVEDDNELEEVKQGLATIIADMESDEKKQLAKVFKEKLGVVNYQKSDDVETLKEILADLS